jgi:tripartite-type tricarboxylate transporter receptor subunit TctC
MMYSHTQAPISSLIKNAFALFLLCMSFMCAMAQNFPIKPIRIVEPAGPGSAVDTAVRDLVPELTRLLGQQVIIDNKPGANGLIGAKEVVRAPADGYTLFHGNINNALNELSASNNSSCCKLGENLIPVSKLFSSPLVLVVNPSVPAKTLKEFLAYAGAHPDQLTYASAGGGSITQLLGELVKNTAGVGLKEIPYKAIGAELPDLLGGHVSAAYLAPVVVAQLIKSGKLNALGVAAGKRVSIISQVPTLAEAGLPNVEASGWNGIFVPQGTPAAVIELLHDQFSKALLSPQAKLHGEEMGYEYGSTSPKEFGEFIKSELNKWSKVAKDAHIVME